MGSPPKESRLERTVTSAAMGMMPEPVPGGGGSTARGMISPGLAGADRGLAGVPGLEGLEEGLASCGEAKAIELGAVSGEESDAGRNVRSNAEPRKSRIVKTPGLEVIKTRGSSCSTLSTNRRDFTEKRFARPRRARLPRARLGVCGFMGEDLTGCKTKALGPLTNSVGFS